MEMRDGDRREGNQGTRGRLSSGGCSGVPGCRDSEMPLGGHPPDQRVLWKWTMKVTTVGRDDTFEDLHWEGNRKIEK